MTSKRDRAIVVSALKHAAPYIRLFKGKVFVIKVGGEVFADQALATALKQIAAGALDLWPMFEVLRRTPTLVLRGALSDILSEETLLKMQERFPSIETRTIEHRGHAPDLAEPDATEAILEFLGALRIQN